MALRRILSKRLSSRTPSPTLNYLNLRPPPLHRCHPPPDSSKNGFGLFRWFLQKRALIQSSSSVSSGSRFGDNLIEQLKEMKRERIRFDGLSPPSDSLEGISVDDAKKLLRLAQLETLKSNLRRIPQSCVSYTEFLQICVENSSVDQGPELAKMLDQSGAVIVLKDTVFIHPEQVAKAIQGLIPLPGAHTNDPRMLKELEKMEKEKSAIDKKAESLARAELWGGLGFLVFQTAGFVRLTFWELSWDVMEPICFYVTSMYFMASYAFFLRTSQEPCFEGFYRSRFRAKQRRLMRTHKFDMERYNQLKKACYPYSSLDQAAASEFHESATSRTLMYQ